MHLMQHMCLCLSIHWPIQFSKFSPESPKIAPHPEEHHNGRAIPNYLPLVKPLHISSPKNPIIFFTTTIIAEHLSTVLNWFSFPNLSKVFHNGKAFSNCPPLALFTTSLQRIPQWQSNCQLSSTGTFYHILSKEFYDGRATSNCLPPA